MNLISGIPNVFGQTKNVNTISSQRKSVWVTLNGGLGVKSGNLFIILDPNPSNDLSLSNLGLLCNISNTPLNMRGHKITSTYIPVNDNDLVNKKYVDTATIDKMNQDDYKIVMNNFNVLKRGIAKNKADVEQFVHDTNDLSVNGNAVGQNSIFGILNDSDLEFVRNDQSYIILKSVREDYLETTTKFYAVTTTTKYIYITDFIVY